MSFSEHFNSNNERFSPILYRQPSLAEGKLTPEPYRSDSNKLAASLVTANISSNNEASIDQIESSPDINVEDDNDLGISALLNNKANSNTKNNEHSPILEVIIHIIKLTFYNYLL